MYSTKINVVLINIWRLSTFITGIYIYVVNNCKYTYGIINNIYVCICVRVN